MTSRGGHAGARVLAALVIAGVLAVVAAPLVVTLMHSMRADGEWTLERFASLLDPRNASNVEAVVNSVWVSLLSVLVSGILGVLFAFVVTQCEFPFRSLMARLAILPVALPPLVGVIAFLFAFGESGILPRGVQALFALEHVPFALDGFPAIVAVHVYSFNVYFLLFVSTALRQVDGSLLEAAQGLGSTPWRTFRRVIVPTLRPAIVSAAVITFMASMASFSAPFLFGGSRRFLTLQIYFSKLNGDIDLAAAQSVFLGLVSVFFFIVLTVKGAGGRGNARAKGATLPRPLPMPGWFKRVLVTTAFLLLGLEVLPLATIVLVSFAREGSWTTQILPTMLTLENYSRFVTDPGTLMPFVNSVGMGIITLAGAVAVGVGGATLLVKGLPARWRTPADILVTAPYAIPGTVIAIGIILAFPPLVGTFAILPLAYFMRTYPMVVRSTSAALDGVDDSLLEAAKGFGAGAWRRFRTVLLPLVLPGIVAGGLLTMISAVGEFVSSILLYTVSNKPVSIEILSQLRMFNFGAASAYAVVLLVLVLLLVAAAGRTRPREGHIFLNF
jgi:iron(III) transport system permease protein